MSKTRIVGSGTKKTETREVPNFTGLELAGVGTVRLSQGPSTHLEIEADDNILPHLLSEVSGGVLSLRQENGLQLETRHPIVYTVVAPEIGLLRLSGAGDVSATDLSGESLKLELSGAGDMTLRGLSYENLNVRFSGMGELELSGSARTQDVALTGAGSVQACALRGENVHVLLSGTGNVHVWATASLSARVSGVGELRYRGEPRLERSVTGIGSVLAADDCP